MMGEKVQETIEQVKSDLEAPVPEPARKREVKKVAKKVIKKGKKVTAEEAKELKSKAKKTNGTKQEDDGLVSVADLANEAKISPQSARVKLRAAELDRGEGRWKWEE